MDALEYHKASYKAYDLIVNCTIAGGQATRGEGPYYSHNAAVRNLHDIADLFGYRLVEKAPAEEAA